MGGTGGSERMIEFISRLPQGYQEVEYIESSGTQYIDTGYKPTGENMRLVMDYMYTASPNGKSLFGAESSSTFPITFYSKSATTADFYIGSTYNVVSYNITTDTRYKLDCHANNGAFTANLNEVAKSETYSGSLLKTLNLFLFTNNGQQQQSMQLISARLYSCQIYDNGTLVRDFVPCYRKADNVAGLYDLVNNVFYTNAGSGVFAVGSNTGELVITPGGIMPFAAALRRRLMHGGKKIKMWTVEVKQTNTGTSSSPYPPIINGVASDTGVYQVEDGDIVTLRGFSFNYDCTIYVNNVCVVEPTRPSTVVTYSYTVRSNCLIEIGRRAYGVGDYFTYLTTQ